MDLKRKTSQNQFSPILSETQVQKYRFRGRLHGEFQPGLKFQPAHRAEILLRLHG